MNSFEETEWRERRDCSDRENWMKVLNMGNIQLFWGPLRQLTPQIQKVNFLENDSTKYRKVVRIRKRLGVSWKLDKTTKLMWLGGRRGVWRNPCRLSLVLQVGTGCCCCCFVFEMRGSIHLYVASRSGRFKMLGRRRSKGSRPGPWEGMAHQDSH